MEFEESVGAVVFHKDKFLVLRYGKGHWGFVKGHIEEDETKEQTVMRELKEETGITNAKIIPGFNEVIGYYFRRKGVVSKKVTFFLIKSNTSNVRISYEHSEYAWLEFEKALHKLTFESTKRVLRLAKEFMSSSH
jgi:8-oxo-dGTP pyrophosphatase MutT (NUDIX family)